MQAQENMYRSYLKKDNITSEIVLIPKTKKIQMITHYEYIPIIPKAKQTDWEHLTNLLVVAGE